MTAPFYIGDGGGRRLVDDDFRRLAARHDLDEAVLRALAQVEARGRGIHTTGAVVALYEPHVAWRHTAGPVRDRLAAAGLARPDWRPGAYPPSPYPSIDRCAAIAGEEVAAMASSWGLGQIMGFNHAPAGYGSAAGMVRDFATSEARQLEAMIRFILASPDMAAALRARDWSGFARRYNGPGYARHGYHTRLARAVGEWDRRMPAARARGAGALRRVPAILVKFLSMITRRYRS